MFVTFEGIDGSGKTTLIKKLEIFFSHNYPNLHIVYTREPGGKNIKESEEIRKIILDKNNDIDSMSEALLYLVSRKIHLEKIIWPSLKQGKVVFCDRFIDSSLAYQGYSRKLGINKIKELNEIVTNKTWPDVTFFLKILPQTSFNRMNTREEDLDRIEKEEKSFFHEVAKGYEKVIELDPKRFIIIDAEKNEDEIFDEVKKHLLKLLNI